MSFNIPDFVDLEFSDAKVRLAIDGQSTGWMSENDLFFKRIDEDSLNGDFPVRHLKKEIMIKNLLDEGIFLFKSQKYAKAIEKFDEVLFYDFQYGEALIYKSYSLRAQKHFIKALRYYNRAVEAEDSLADREYHDNLLTEAGDERADFPQWKADIYNGDEYFARREFQMAIESYDRALDTSCEFKNRILSKLLNKKASACLELNDFENALDCFRQSSDACRNDYAIFGEGVCEYELNLRINPEFRSFLKISKPRMLKQALVLKDLGYCDESSGILDYLRSSHFKKDELYHKIHMD